MSLIAIAPDLVSIELPLGDIYLDPNNPRFVGQDWNPLPDEEIDSEVTQDGARLRLVREFAVDKLRMNMEVNGYLPIDRVVVREFKPGKFVVLEGNRRICAAKLISRYTADGSEIAPEVTQSLKTIPCLQYVGMETDASWIFQGLRHITGINDWSAFNKAKLLVEQMEREHLSLSEVGKRFGLTPHGAGQWVRGYYAFKQAREESDYINEVDERAYPYFQELFSRSSTKVREWLEWDEGQRHFRNAINFNEFVSWLYRRMGDDGDDEEVTGSPGEWDRRALKTRDDIRQIAFLLREDKEAFESFRRDQDIERAYAEAMTRQYQREARETHDAGAEVFRAIRECVKALNDIPFRLLKDPSTKSSLIAELDQLRSSIAALLD